MVQLAFISGSEIVIIVLVVLLLFGADKMPGIAKEIGKGTGLGMNIAYNIIQEHKGKIFVQSTVGKGTTITVSLPGKI